VVKNVFWCVFAYFQITKKMFWKKIFLTVWSGKKRVLMHFRILPDHQKLFFKKDIFERLEWLKMCFDAFPHTSRPPKSIVLKRCFWTSVVFKNVFDAFAHISRPPETFFQKRYFWTSRVVKNVFWCICAYFQPTRNFFSKKIFLKVWSG
jgi:hypothetical protein